jgi:hypothetical protein
MKKVVALLIIFGSGLAAFGFSGWQFFGTTDRYFQGGWSNGSRIEMAVGVMLLAWGVMLRRDLK